MNTTPNNTDLLTRLEIWWVCMTARQKARVALIGYTIFLIATNGLFFWSLNSPYSDTTWFSYLFVLHMYLWCAGITGWLLMWRTKNHPMTQRQVVKWMVFGPIALFLIVAILIIHFSGDRSRRY